MSAWGPPSSGAWANQVDEEEEENGGELDPVPAPSPAAFPALGGETAFPALGESINIRDSKKDRKQKKVKQTMPLQAFVAAGRKEPEVVNLPTGPRQRTAEEEERRGGLGGGFRNYGGDRGGASNCLIQSHTCPLLTKLRKSDSDGTDYTMQLTEEIHCCEHCRMSATIQQP